MQTAAMLTVGKQKCKNIWKYVRLKRREKRIELHGPVKLGRHPTKKVTLGRLAVWG